MGNRNPDGGFSCGNARPEVQADGGAGTYCKPPLQKKSFKPLHNSGTLRNG